MKRFFTLAAFLVFFSFSSSAQTTPCDSTTWAKEGTYELIKLDKIEEVFLTDFLCWVESQRDELNVVEITLSPYTMIRIFPKSELTWRVKN